MSENKLDKRQVFENYCRNILKYTVNQYEELDVHDTIRIGRTPEYMAYLKEHEDAYSQKQNAPVSNIQSVNTGVALQNTSTVKTCVTLQSDSLQNIANAFGVIKTPITFMLYTYLHTKVNDDKIVTIVPNEISKSIGVCKRSIERAQRELENLGFIKSINKITYHFTGAARLPPKS